MGYRLLLGSRIYVMKIQAATLSFVAVKAASLPLDLVYLFLKLRFVSLGCPGVGHMVYPNCTPVAWLAVDLHPIFPGAVLVKLIQLFFCLALMAFLHAVDATLLANK